MDLLNLVKHKIWPKRAPKPVENQIDPEHFFEKIGFQNLYSDLMETVEVDINELNNLAATQENPSLVTNSIVSTKSSYANSMVSSVKEDSASKLSQNSNNEDFVRDLLNEDEKKPPKKKVLRLKNYMDNFFNRAAEKET